MVLLNRLPLCILKNKHKNPPYDNNHAVDFSVLLKARVPGRFYSDFSASSPSSQEQMESNVYESSLLRTMAETSA